MKRILTLILATASLTACISANKTARETSLEKLEKLPMGISQEQVLAVFGTPSTKEVDGKKEIWIYSIPYKKIMIPETTLIYESGVLKEKTITIFGLDGTRLHVSDFKKRYPKNSFTALEETYATSNHSYSRRGLLKDEKAGIFAEYNTARNNEIQTIRWVQQRISASN